MSQPQPAKMPDGDATPAANHEPKNSKFKQQTLPAWQPILTAGTVLPTFFVIGVAFIPIGVGLMYFSNTVKEVLVEYTDCTQVATDKMCKDFPGKLSPPQILAIVFFIMWLEI